MRTLVGRLYSRLGFRYIDPSAVVTRNVSLGRRVHVGRNAQLVANENGEVVIGDDCKIETGAILAAYGGRIVLGKRVGVNPYSVLYGHGGLSIGDNTLIACHCTVVPANHNFSLDNIPIQDQGLNCKGIYIGSNVWIGTGVRILDGVRIEDGAVIAAGAVVTRDVLADSVVGGVPARFLKNRFESDKVRIVKGIKP